MQPHGQTTSCAQLNVLKSKYIHFICYAPKNNPILAAAKV